VGTPGALAAMERAGQTPHEFLDRHVQGKGDIDAEDAQANEAALRNGERLLSAYWTANGERLSLITEADRSLTTILLPEEYLSLPEPHQGR
jgi:hypothetical protein